MANPVVQQLKQIVNDLKTLEVVTIVGDVSITEDADGRKVIAPAQGARQLVTHIDLVDGDITTAVGDDFVTGDLQALRQFHAEQVQRGHDIIVKNVTMLIDLAESVGEKLG